MPPAARVSDMHVCPMVTPGVPPIPHVGGPILPPGVPTVLIDFLPAATVTDMATCVGPPDTIAMGSAGVLINFLPAARLGDATIHGGTIVMGSPTCIIGEVGSPSPGAAGAAGVASGLAASGVASPAKGNVSVLASANKQLDAMYQQAPAAKAEIDSVAHAVADRYGGSVSAPAPKSRERSLEKVVNEYDGNAGALKDLVRNTIVVPAGQESAALQSLQQAMPGKVDRVKIADPASDPCGYSGIIVNVRTQSGLIAEIQINSPEMIYAKEPLAKSASILPKEAFDKLANDPALPPGGNGHLYYEQWRSSPPGSPQRLQAAANSRSYYAAFRR